MLITEDQLKQLIVKTGLANAKKLEEIELFAKNANIGLDEAIIDKDIISDEQLGLLVADFLKIPFVVLSKITIPDDVFRIIPERIARKQKIIAFAQDKDGIRVAMLDPKNKEFLQLLARKIGKNVSAYLATERDIYNTLHIYRKDIQQTFDQLLKEELDKKGNLILDSAPAAKIVDLFIDYAYQDKASDIHIEPEEKHSLVRFRIDGIMHDILVLPKALHDQIVTRIKVQSRLRTDEHLSPQDGKMRMKLAEEDFDIRVSIIPVAEGEKVVLRLLVSRFRKFSLLDLGMNDSDLKKVTAAINKSYGMILSTGPTGSGKTTSIYSILKIINTREKNITTIEDPIEYRIKGVNQIQTNTKTNLTFANGLRSILRQDPNIIFVGEIRDSETAGIAVNAALTGHLVLSTLHTNDAATALPRLIDMKVEPFLVASTVNIIIAQRLVRKICEMCKTSIILTRKDILQKLPEETVKKHFIERDEIRVYYGKGCKICHSTGYEGRIGIFEILEITKEVRALITAKADSDVIEQAAKAAGMTSMLDDGLAKVIKGLSTIEEVFRATKVDSL